ncbi:hypothetical protein AEAC466_05855 [Asticcacaulis sp. AC466]|uniref:TlpA disulfide reductase family protein n=1 Tax=Asticcacaulis sp. AC466 TaxID=1282362 RepID=UPI0003C3DAC2|nr:TlpA disulfide reductase family protein [Asticcacaulis sp. AC466]ESQ85234.1 hypothetical protein AEAC466_05855 [Asticcacaulis sp. AC466]
MDISLAPKTRTRPTVKQIRGLAAACLAFAGSLMLGFNPSHAADGQIDLSAYKGKVVYLDFWASWCGPCKNSFPYMENLKAAHAGDDLVIITVNLDHSRQKADAFLKSLNSDLNVVYDPKGSLASTYRIKDMPTSLLIGRDGRVRYVHNGFFPAQTAEYRAQIESLLREK